MRIEGDELRRILAVQTQLISMYDRRGNLVGELSPTRALAIASAHFGIGNRRRVRHMRPYIEVSRRNWRGGSHSTNLVRSEGTEIFAKGQVLSRTLYQHTDSFQDAVVLK